ncbi:MAG TPA: hypothetical protein ENH28_07675 [Euryarchaeota archaeon]|nr:hypothetical protein BMS3Abin08_00283 [bacterium BMS3Abin08]HDL16013.1 hypothetical protein [Euryarchaeota archaeon]HDZ61623.1 hypothetical protein [Nitrospirota bacterium]
MQKDFHYDIVYALAREAGYKDKEAYIIAYASQYVDDNTDREYIVSDSFGEFYVDFPSKIGKSGEFYFPIITQAVDITSFKLSVQKYIYAPFHFIPGDNNAEIKGRSNPLCTTKNCKNAKFLLKDALKEKDPYRIGVALHTYADTWSHERFSAFHENWNRVYKYNIFKSFPPNIGHGEVFHKPDEISVEWVDERFGKDKIDNRERALEASEKIFGFIKKGKAKWSDARDKFEQIMNAEDKNKRIKHISEMYPEIEDYNSDKWINEALHFSRDASEISEPDLLNPQISKPRFVGISVKNKKSHWFRFQKAAKKQLSIVLSMVDAI